MDTDSLSRHAVVCVCVLCQCVVMNYPQHSEVMSKYDSVAR